MAEDKDTDGLEKSSRRLGQRFSNSSEGSESREQSNDSKEATQSVSPESSDEESTTVDWKPTTVYLPEDTRREFRRFLKRVTLDYPEIEDAEKRQLHTALIRVGMEYPEEVAELTEREL